MLPLSDLTNKIEYKGEVFVPLDKLKERWKYIKQDEDGEIYHAIDVDVSESGDDFSVVTGTGFIVEEFIEDKRIIRLNDNLPHWIILQLIEWKFDVFGMLGHGKAISVDALMGMDDVDIQEEETRQDEEE